MVYFEVVEDLPDRVDLCPCDDPDRERAGIRRFCCCSPFRFEWETADIVVEPSSSDSSSTALMRFLPLLLVDLEASESVREDFLRRGLGVETIAVCCGTSHLTSLDQSSVNLWLDDERLEER